MKHVVAEWPLVVAANRDERRSRPWQAPRQQQKPSHVTCPIDLQGGGTWIGTRRSGMVVALTNRRTQADVAGRRSRGLLVLDVLACRNLVQARAHLDTALCADDYNDFNLLLADRDGGWVLHLQGGAPCWVPLADGTHVLSNFHDLDKSALQDVRTEAASAAALGWEACQAHLRVALGDHRVRPPGHRICKHDAVYGTLCASLIGVPAIGAPLWQFAAGPPCETAFAAVA